MVTRVEDRVLRQLNYALVDEVDSILIDESRTPLIISGGQRNTANLYIKADRFVKSLKKQKDSEQGEEIPEEDLGDYSIDVKSRTVQLTERGIKKGEQYFNLDNLYDLELAEMRLKNPELSLIDLGKKLQKPIGKSGVNYRMKKIIELSKECD